MIESSIKMKCYVNASSELASTIETIAVPSVFDAAVRLRTSKLVQHDGAYDRAIAAITVSDWDELAVQLTSIAATISEVELIATRLFL